MASAYNAYLKSTDPVERGVALFVIGRDYDRHDKQKEALAAFDAGLNFTRLARGRRARRRTAPARRLPRHQGRNPGRSGMGPRLPQVQRDPRAKGDVSYGAFVRNEPRLDGIVTARGDTMCLDGMKHGGTYQIEVLAGLPGATGEPLRETSTTRVVIPDRKPQLRFSGTGYVLPRRDLRTAVDHRQCRQGQTAAVAGQRAQPRSPSIDAERLTTSFSPSYEVDEIINRTGSLVWEGEMTIAGERDRPVVTTAIPLKDILREKGPGRLSRRGRTHRPDARPICRAGDGSIVSDLGITAYKGTDGLAVDVRSLADSKPMPGVAVRLYARNNGELAAATSDARGDREISGRVAARPRRGRAVCCDGAWS